MRVREPPVAMGSWIGDCGQKVMMHLTYDRVYVRVTNDDVVYMHDSVQSVQSSPVLGHLRT